MQHSVEDFSEKQRRVELKYVWNFVAKTVLVESASQFSFEELRRTQYSLKTNFRSHIDHDTYGKTLRNKLSESRSAVLGWFVCFALRFIPHEPRKKTHIPYIYNTSNQESFLKFSEKRYKYKTATVTCNFILFTSINHCACDLPNSRISLW